MKKSLIALSGFLAIGAGSLTNSFVLQENNTTVNTNLKNQNYEKIWDWSMSLDWIAYDLTNDESKTEKFDLPNLLLLFNEIQRQYHWEDINQGGLWSNYSFLGGGVDVAKFLPDEVANFIESLFISKDVQFNNTSILVSKDEYRVMLNYSDKNITKAIELFNYNDGYIPLKNTYLQIQLNIYYNEHEGLLY